MARRTRTTVTVREDDPVPRNRSVKRKTNTIWIVLVAVLLGLYLLSRNHGSDALRPQPAAVRH